MSADTVMSIVRKVEIWMCGLTDLVLRRPNGRDVNEIKSDWLQPPGSPVVFVAAAAAVSQIFHLQPVLCHEAAWHPQLYLLVT